MAKCKPTVAKTHTSGYPQNTCSVESNVVNVSKDIVSKETVHHGETDQTLNGQHSCKKADHVI